MTKKLPKTPVDAARRDLLKTIAASGISGAILSASPLLAGLIVARQAEAQGVPMPNKSVVVYVPGGGIWDLWAPSGSGSAMTLRPMSMAYEPVKTECNFLRNMSHADAGHGRMPKILSNRWGGSGADSYDVFMGKQLGPDLPFTFVNLGVHSNGQGYITRDGNTQIPFEDNPFNALRLLFSGQGSGNEKDPILDAHMAAAQRIRQRLAGYEVHRLDEHLTAIEDTRRRLDELAGGVGCASAPADDEFPLDHDSFTRQARLQADIAVAALKCNLTRSVSIGFGNHQSQFRIPELGYQGIYHQSIHGGSGGLPDYPYYTEMRNHLGGLTAYLIDRLRQEGLLDTTMVVETTDMGHADRHGSTDVPYILAGGGGRIHRGVSNAGSPDYNHLDLLHTAAQACGVTLDYGRVIPGVLT